MSLRSGLKDIKRVVFKVGTSSITYPNGKLNINKIDLLIRVISDLKNRGLEVTLVSSGAIGVDVGKLGFAERPHYMPSKQAAAAVGQCELMYLYDKLFSEYGHTTAQVLLTKDAVDIAERRENAKNILHRLLELGAVPIVNENDAVATEEIEFGDNDTLSAYVAVLANAQLLVILSDIEGLFDKDPHKNSDARLIGEVDEITPEIRSLAGGAGSRQGSGGMITKLDAAQIAAEENIKTIVCSSSDPRKIYDIFDEENIGTIFGGKL
ncbi:MAG: glutamate 5-kinase [Clostridia bacterium]|nr:glutamate 5-kinase [Clostridia bacterium]